MLTHHRRMEADFVRSGLALGFSQHEVEELLADHAAALEAAERLERAAEKCELVLARELRARATWLRESVPLEPQPQKS
jgi:hypothetical protein